MTTDALAERYGAPAPWRRKAVISGVVVMAVVFAGWLGWTIWEQSRPVVSSGDLTYTVVDDNVVQAQFRVEYRGEPVPATCTLKAYAEDHTLVGQLGFSPQPSPDGAVQQRVSTERRATSVDLMGCTSDGQPRPR